jgi:hypothetical protein
MNEYTIECARREARCAELAGQGLVQMARMVDGHYADEAFCWAWTEEQRQAIAVLAHSTPPVAHLPAGEALARWRHGEQALDAEIARQIDQRRQAL